MIPITWFLCPFVHVVRHSHNSTCFCNNAVQLISSSSTVRLLSRESVRTTILILVLRWQGKEQWHMAKRAYTASRPSQSASSKKAKRTVNVVFDSKTNCGPADALRKRTLQKTSDAAAVIAELEGKIAQLQRQFEEVKIQKGEDEEGSHGEGILATPRSEELSLEEEHRRFVLFNPKSKTFAVIYLPPSLTVQKLRREKPLLYMAIMAVTSTTAH
ncbi:hypothetical protein BJY01DRAFT_195156 [Aspergillus pseudoustus]|uniref:Uncharacterized protein n=1 Tax=Aspergillus pseudoustus TaxID=1810923 RepID=A0ABR4KUB3_9EURO